MNQNRIRAPKRDAGISDLARSERRAIVSGGTWHVSSDSDAGFGALMIPGRDGYAVCQEIRSNPAWRDGRIMMLTAKGGDIQREKGLSLGADEYVTKPSPRASWSNGFAACSIGGIDHVARPDRDRNRRRFVRRLCSIRLAGPSPQADLGRRPHGVMTAIWGRGPKILWDFGRSQRSLRTSIQMSQRFLQSDISDGEVC
jgi:CheY-like chemotaxis protein